MVPFLKPFIIGSYVVFKIVLLCNMTSTVSVNGPVIGVCVFNPQNVIYSGSLRSEEIFPSIYSLEGSQLEFLDKIKYLGVYITNDLNWKYHINAMCNNASRTLGLLKRNLKMCPKSVKLQAYKGLVRPGLEFASAAWDPFQIYLQDKIEKVQKRSASSLPKIILTNLVP